MEFFSFAIFLSENGWKNCLCRKWIYNEVSLEFQTDEDRSSNDFSFDIVEHFLSIWCPFEPLLLFPQQIDRLYDACVVRNKSLHKIYFFEEWLDSLLGFRGVDLVYFFKYFQIYVNRFLSYNMSQQFSLSHSEQAFLWIQRNTI